jgi:hypothetical protein
MDVSEIPKDLRYPSFNIYKDLGNRNQKTGAKWKLTAIYVDFGAGRGGRSGRGVLATTMGGGRIDLDKEDDKGRERVYKEIEEEKEKGNTYPVYIEYQEI